MNNGRVFFDFTSNVEDCPIRADILSEAEEEQERNNEAFPPPEDENRIIRIRWMEGSKMYAIWTFSEENCQLWNVQKSTHSL